MRASASRTQPVRGGRCAVACCAGCRRASLPPPTRSHLRLPSTLPPAHPLPRAADKSSLGILVKSTTSDGSGWSWINPFSWSLWLALCITLIVFPPVIFLIEFLSLRRRIHK